MLHFYTLVSTFMGDFYNATVSMWPYSLLYLFSDDKARHDQNIYQKRCASVCKSINTKPILSEEECKCAQASKHKAVHMEKEIIERGVRKRTLKVQTIKYSIPKGVCRCAQVCRHKAVQRHQSLERKDVYKL